MNGNHTERVSQESECRNEEESGILASASAFAWRGVEKIETFAGTKTCYSVKQVKSWRYSLIVYRAVISLKARLRLASYEITARFSMNIHGLSFLSATLHKWSCARLCRLPPARTYSLARARKGHKNIHKWLTNFFSWIIPRIASDSTCFSLLTNGFHRHRKLLLQPNKIGAKNEHMFIGPRTYVHENAVPLMTFFIFFMKSFGSSEILFIFANDKVCSREDKD